MEGLFMKKTLFLTLLLMVVSAIAELPVPQTKFRKAPLETLQNYADGGNAEAQLELALRYYAGHQVQPDASQALGWMRRSAEGGHPEAAYLLSRMYAEGIGTAVDRQQEVLWFAKALAADPENEELKQQYRIYLSHEPDTDAFLNVCMDAGYVPAMVDLGLPSAKKLYDAGNILEAVERFQKLSDAGSAEAAYYLARIVDLGQGGLQADEAEAFAYYRKAADGGYVPAQLELARMYVSGRGTSADAVQAEHWYREAADGGSAAAQVRLAAAAFDQAVALESWAPNEYRKHLKAAVAWYRSAAEQHNAEALYMMGRLTASGEGLPKDHATAVEYYEEAATLGYPEALFYLGLMHHAGFGVEQNIPLAADFYRQASEKGVTGASYYLANCYRFGKGVEKQPVRGEALYYSKILKSRIDHSAGRRVVSSRWVLEAAREYAAIRWNKAVSAAGFFEASGWAGLAAQNGDEAAQSMLAKMLEPSGIEKRSGVELEETAANPREDAVRRVRNPRFFPYAIRPLDELYRDSDIRPRILIAEKRDGRSKNVAGDKLTELFVKYQVPPGRKAVDLRGILLFAMELTDNETGERHLAFSTRQPQPLVFSDGSIQDTSMIIDMAAYPNTRISGWAVLYGHLLDDGLTIAVFDEKSRSKTADSLADLYVQNRYSAPVSNQMLSTIDLLQTVQPATDTDGTDINIDLNPLDGLLK